MIVEELVGRIGLDFKGAAEAAKAVSAVDSVKGALLGAFGVMSVFKAGFEGLTLHVAEEALHMEHFAEAVGVSSQTLQALGVAAGRVGGSIEDVETGLRFLANNSVAATQEGGDKLAGVFAELGVKLHGANGQLRTVEELLPDVARGFEKIENPSKRVSAAIDLFGRGGLRTLQALQQTGGDLDTFKTGLIASGRVFEQDTLDRFAKVAKGIKSLGGRFKGLNNLFAAAFLPFTEKTVKTLTDALSKITPFFAEFATRFANLIGKSFMGLFGVATDLGKSLGRLFTSFPQWLQITIELATALGLLAFAFTLPGVPILVLAALIAAIFEDIQNFRDGMPSLIGDIVKEWDNFKFQIEDLSKTTNGFLSILTGLLDTLLKVGSAIGAVFSGKGIQGVIDAATPHLGGDQLALGQQIRTASIANRFRNSPFANDAVDTFSRMGSGEGPAPRVGAPPSVVNQGAVTVNVTATPGMNEQDLADKVAAEVKNQMDFTAEEVASAFGRE